LTLCLRRLHLEDRFHFLWLGVLIQIQFQRPNAGRRANFHVIEMTRYDRYRWAPGAPGQLDRFRCAANDIRTSNKLTI